LALHRSTRGDSRKVGIVLHVKRFAVLPLVMVFISGAEYSHYGHQSDISEAHALILKR
jgi:hypothetical protein